MKQKTRIIIALAIIAILAVIILTVDFVQRRRSLGVEPGSIPVYVDGDIGGYILPSQLTQLETSTFVDTEEGKTQEGWLLRDALNQIMNVKSLAPGAEIIISSSSREKSVTIPWADVSETVNMVMFDLSSRGTLKLVSEKLAYLDSRDEWVQDVDKIEVW